MAAAIGTRYSTVEELANGLSHGLGALLSLVGLAVLVTFAALRGDPWKIVSFSIYGASLLLLYLASTLYHLLRSERAKTLFRMFDHGAIFLLIAGTYTPLALVTLRGPWGWTLFGLNWAFALAGFILTIFYFGRFRALNIGIYIGMGWLVLIAAKPLVEQMPVGGILWLGIGGVIYTVGVPFYAWRSLPFNHAIWHLFVLGGSVCQFISIWAYVLPA